MMVTPPLSCKFPFNVVGFYCSTVIFLPHPFHLLWSWRSLTLHINIYSVIKIIKIKLYRGILIFEMNWWFIVDCILTVTCWDMWGVDAFHPIYYLWSFAGVVNDRVREAHQNKSAPIMMLFPGSALFCYHSFDTQHTEQWLCVSPL